MKKLFNLFFIFYFFFKKLLLNFNSQKNYIVFLLCLEIVLCGIIVVILCIICICIYLFEDYFFYLL